MKGLILILLTIGLSYMTVLADKQCQMEFYGPIPPPVCETYIDENGQEQEQCYQLGSPAAALLMDKDNNNYSDATFGAVEYYFSGDCNCVLQLWPENDFIGISKNLIVNRIINRDIIVEKCWKKEPKSFKIVCNF